jgi:cell division protein FtsQ
VLVGRHDADARVARFARLAPRLLARAGRPPLRADLRYTNGFALAWADAAPVNPEGDA